MESGFLPIKGMRSACHLPTGQRRACPTVCLGPFRMIVTRPGWHGATFLNSRLTNLVRNLFDQELVGLAPAKDLHRQAPIG
jgi:hypothetical protein